MLKPSSRKRTAACGVLSTCDGLCVGSSYHKSRDIYAKTLKLDGH